MPVVFFCKLADKPFSQRHNVFLAFAQRWQGDVHGVYAVKQVLAKTAFTHQRLQIHIRGADQPDVHRDGLGATDPYNAAVLKHPQQLGLQVQRDVPDLIEEQRAAVGLLELADMVGMCIGECALHVAEQLALEESLSDGAGVDSHHWLAAAQAQGMYLAGQHVLAGAVFAGDQHRGIRRSNLVDGLADRRHRS